jgi:GT2 family glycosyltransferase
MKIKFYVVTYNRKDHLNKTLESLFTTDIAAHGVEVIIVNNHSNFSLAEKFIGQTRVLHNSMRPDFSTGHLSRNYNEIFMHGFRDLSNPDCDIVMHSHDDNTFDSQLFGKMIEHHQKFDLVTFSQGCGFMSYTPEAVRKIGMWDERFCTLGYHEGDYFLRALRYHKEKVSLNDPGGERNWQQLTPLVIKPADSHGLPDHLASWKYYSVCRRLWEMKWGNWKDVSWTDEQMNNVIKPQIPCYMQYPYFEKDIYDLEEKYYADIQFEGRPFL